MLVKTGNKKKNANDEETTDEYILKWYERPNNGTCFWMMNKLGLNIWKNMVDNYYEVNQTISQNSKKMPISWLSVSFGSKKIDP